ncbi:MAG: hypothetical protein KF833_09570 [Verrucomicrobiae bacterium]|nr:hypothetical protein [Verrucomicrobiae bacterium]
MKLSDCIALDARFTAELSQRSIAGQIEYWANLGRGIEQVIQRAALHPCGGAGCRTRSGALRLVAVVEKGQPVRLNPPVPRWLQPWFGSA